MQYEKTKKDAKKWNPIVQNQKNQRTVVFGDYTDLLDNRSTKALSSELQLKIGASSSSSSSSKPVDSAKDDEPAFEDELERAIAESGAVEELLKDRAAEQGMNIDTNKDFIGEATLNPHVKDEKTHQQMSHLRALMLRELQRSKRLKKIKSKSFRRTQRKNEAKERDKLLERLEGENPELAAELKRDYEKKLAQMRNRRGAEARKKWARAAQRFGGAAIQNTISEQAQKAEDEKKALQRALKGKSLGGGDGSDSDEFSDIDVDGSDSEGGEEDLYKRAEKLAKKELEESGAVKDAVEGEKKGLFGMKFMKDAMVKKHEQAQQQTSDLLAELKQMKRAERKEQGEHTDSEEEAAVLDSGDDKKVDSDEEDSDEEDKFTAEQLAEAEDALRAQGLLDARDEKKVKGEKKSRAKVAQALKVADDGS